MRLRFVLGLMLVSVCAAPVVQAADVELVSSDKPVELVELFTSQGCSSCPPADAWLSGLQRHPGLWRDFVPLAWHVDYWNDLGWRDIFSSPAYSARQRAYQAAGYLRTVYTPAVLVDGRPWRAWYTGRALPDAMSAPVGRLRLTIEGERVMLGFEPMHPAPAQTYRVHLAVLGMGYATPVGRGENSGRTLHEDFVVLAHHVSDSRRADAGLHWRMALPRVSAAQRLAVAAWVVGGSDPMPLQAVGGWLH
ncbi:MAG: DUF1223 domain-containing protein [Gammaproteobacteria bacterium]|jgi:hypothetical protein